MGQVESIVGFYPTVRRRLTKGWNVTVKRWVWAAIVVIAVCVVLLNVQVRVGSRDAVPGISTAETTPCLFSSIETMRSAVDQVADCTDRLSRQILVTRITTYMQNATCSPRLIDLVPLMVDLGKQTNMDCRLCAVTAKEESSGGQRSYDLFGTKGHSSIGDASWETQVRWYFDRIKQISDKYGWCGNVYSLAWFWHGGGSQGTNHDFYAGNITQAVQNI